MSKKVHVEIVHLAILDIDDGVELSQVMDELEVTMADTTGSARVLDFEMRDYECEETK